MPNVIIVAPVHVWDDVRVFYKQASTLAAAGYRVTLIARTPNPKHVNGVRVISPRGIYRSRVLRFLSLPLVAWQVLRAQPDITHCHNPDTLPLALLFALLGKKVIYDTHEDFSQRLLMREWIPSVIRSPLAKAVSQLERLTLKAVSAGFATQESVVARLGKKCTLLGNPPLKDEALIQRAHAKACHVHKAVDTLYLVYIGQIGKHRGLFAMVKALEIINQHTACRLWLIGPYEAEALEKARTFPGWRYVEFHPRMSQNDAFAYVARADVGLVYIDDIADHAVTDPNKLYEYMLFRKPFIASRFPLWEQRLAYLSAGIFVPAGKPAELAAAVLALNAKGAQRRVQMGERGYQYICENNWEQESQKLLEVYKQLSEADV